MLERRRALLSAWFNGPYHLTARAPVLGGGRMVDVERYSDKYARGKQEMAPLEEVVVADQKYVPLELFPGRRAGAAAAAAAGGGRENGEGALLARMMAGQAGTADREARLEARLEAAVRAEARLGLRQAGEKPPRLGGTGLPESVSPTKAATLAGGGLEDAIEAENLDSEEEGDYGDEDYLLGEAFDDDDGYVDPYGDDGADGDAYY